MSKTFKIYAVIFVILLIVMGIFQVNKKPLLDWRKNFDVEKKSPFGLFVFDKEAPQLFQNKLEKVTISPYNYYTSSPAKKNHNILIIEKKLDNESWKKILIQIKNGSDALIFSTKFPQSVEDSLQFRIGTETEEDNYILKLTDKKLQTDKISMTRLPDQQNFIRINEGQQILGTIVTLKDKKSYANFIKINYGKGHFYLHSEPLVTTNYYLLRSNPKYLENVISFLPNRETVWFLQQEKTVSSSPMRFILDNPPLRYAWYLLLIGLIVFVIFNAKRKQRIVPIVEPLKNTSLDFVKSIGNLYLQEGDFHDMMAKKAQYFLNRVRMDLLIDTSRLDEDFINKLHYKTGKSIDQIKKAVVFIEKAQDPYASVMREDLADMNKILDDILT